MELSYSGDEFRSFLGQSNAQISTSGTVVAPGLPPAPVMVEATDELVIQVDVKLELEIS